MTLDERRHRVAEIYATGVSLAEVAAIMGISTMTVQRDLKALGIERRRRKYPKPAERVCELDGCDNRFTPRASHVRDGYGRFCSRDHGNEARRIHPIVGERECKRPGCDNRFTPTPSNVAMGWGNYCSRDCSLEHNRPVRNKGQWVACAWCGKKFWRRDCEHHAGRYCSREHWGLDRFWRLALVPKEIREGYPTGAARRRWGGRCGGPKGASGGSAGGAPTKMTPEQAKEIWQLRHDDQTLSFREISARVFGDAKYKDRVARALRQK